MRIVLGIKNNYLQHKSLNQVTKKPEDSHFWSGLRAVKDLFLFRLIYNTKWPKCEILGGYMGRNQTVHGAIS